MRDDSTRPMDQDALPECVARRAVAASGDDGSELALDVADALLRTCVDDLAPIVGIGRRRWRRIRPDGPVAARIADGAIVVAPSVWLRTASAAAGAAALPSRTAARFGVPRAALDPTVAGRPRLLDLLRARRARRRLARLAATLDAELARCAARVASTRAAVTAPNADGSSHDTAPAYSHAARVQTVLTARPGDWTAVAATWLIGTDAQRQDAAELLGRALDLAMELLDLVAASYDAGEHPRTVVRAVALARGAR